MLMMMMVVVDDDSKHAEQRYAFGVMQLIPPHPVAVRLYQYLFWL